VGTFGLRASNGATETIFEYASIPHAMSATIRGDESGRGLPCIVDEISLADSGALMTLQAVLEGEPLTISENGGETIFPDPGFQLIACDNTRGLGEAVAYVATLPVNEAFRDRFLFCEIGYSPNEKAIIRATV
jgi:MoxR-like ATPase